MFVKSVRNFTEYQCKRYMKWARSLSIEDKSFFSDYSNIMSDLNAQFKKHAPKRYVVCGISSDNEMHIVRPYTYIIRKASFMRDAEVKNMFEYGCLTRYSRCNNRVLHTFRRQGDALKTAFHLNSLNWSDIQSSDKDDIRPVFSYELISESRYSRLSHLTEKVNL